MEESKHSKKKNRRTESKRGGTALKLLPNNIPGAIIILLMMIVAVAFFAMLVLMDILPTSAILIAIGVLFALLLAARLLLGNRKKGLRILGIAVATLFIFVFGAGTYYLGTAYATLAKITDVESNASGEGTDVDVTKDSFNIYITGIDQWESEKGLDLERSDVNMIITVCPLTNRVLLTSIPRDTYVKLHTSQAMDKLTHSGIYGVDETISTVEDWFGIDINYYFKMNFNAVCNIIDAIGGVDIYSPIEFVPTKRSWYTVKKGWNHMSGREALAFARERKAYEDGDSARVENQQKVVNAAIKKVTTSPALLTGYSDILNAASDNMQTNMTSGSIQKLVKSQLVSSGEWKVENQKIEGEYDMDYVASLTQKRKFDVFRPSDESVEKALKKIDEVMNPTDEEIEKAMDEKSKNALSHLFEDLINRDK